MTKSEKRHLASVALGAALAINDKAALARVAEALEAEDGNVWRTCVRLGVAHTTFCRWRRQIPKLERLVKAARKKAK